MIPFLELLLLYIFSCSKTAIFYLFTEQLNKTFGYAECLGETIEAAIRRCSSK